MDERCRSRGRRRHHEQLLLITPRASGTFASRAFAFYTSLTSPRVPRGVKVMNPYVDADARNYLRTFLDRYFADNEQRLLVLGINPGRFGAGITGVTFTDPVVLADRCGVPNQLPRKRELSSIFVYEFIDKCGGERVFFGRYFLTAVSPLGFTRGGKNLNYYDVPRLRTAVTPFIVEAISRQIAIGGRSDRAIVLGRGQNLRFLRRINEEHGFFREIHALDHPRFIMQYRRKRLAEYLREYQKVFAKAAQQ